jgi:hypothetical protein
VSICIDGEKKFGFYDDRCILYPDVKILTINKNTKLLYVDIETEDEVVDFATMYRYTGNKLVAVGNLKKIRLIATFETYLNDKARQSKAHS